MSGQVVDAVLAVVSAFHTGGELVKRIKKRHHRRRKSKQAYEEDQLQDALQRGEAQIEERYAADCREIGPRFRVGDAIARDRLQHILVVMQAEIIRSLQIAENNENAVLNLTVLHEASVLNRQDAIRALEDLKLRLQTGMSLHQNLSFTAHDVTPTERSSMESTQTFMTASDLMPAAVTVPKTPEPSKGTISRLLSRTERAGKNDVPDGPKKWFSLGENRVIPALPPTGFLRSGTGSGLSLDRRLPSPRYPHADPSDPGMTAPGPQATMPMLGPPAIQPLAPHPQPSSGNGGVHRGRSSNSDGANPLPPMPANLPLPPPEVPDFTQNRTAYSYPELAHELQGLQVDDRARQRQDSAQENYIPLLAHPNQERLLGSPHGVGRHPSTSTSSGYSDNASLSPSPRDGPLASHRSSSTSYFDYSGGVSPISNSAGPDPVFRGAFQPNYQRVPRSATGPVTSSAQQAGSSSAPTMTSRTDSISKSSDSSSIALPSSTTMLGRPCKENNYWGFCKGAWAAREGLKKGISLQTRPTGVYSNISVWQCKYCSFQGSVFTNPSAPSDKKSKNKDYIVDPRLHFSPCGIRYRWIFLAKSHAKKKNVGHETEDWSYGCLFCCAEGKASGIFGNVDMLMEHIEKEHSEGMSAELQERTRCVWGREPRLGEEFDIQVLPRAHELPTGLVQEMP